jgi:hypothetical protein
MTVTIQHIKDGYQKEVKFMGKKYSRGNQAAQKYRNRIRRGRSMVVKVPWGKELKYPEGYSLLYPPPGWLYWENNWGRGYYKLESIATPYDRGLSEEDKKRMFPDWYKRYYSAKGITPPLDDDD